MANATASKAPSSRSRSSKTRTSSSSLSSNTTTTTTTNTTPSPTSTAADNEATMKHNKGNIVTRNTSPSEVLLIYGLSLMICGALAFQASGYKDSAKSSLYMGNGGAVISFILAAGTRKMSVLERGQPGYVLMMISIHLALLYPLAMAGIIYWRVSLAWNVEAKAYVMPYFIAIIVNSFATFALLYCFKPVKSNKTDEDDDNQSCVTSRGQDGEQEEHKLKHLSSDETTASSVVTQDAESDVNGSSDAFVDGENGTLGTMGSNNGGDGNTVNSYDAAATQSHGHHRHGAKSSGGDKPQKQQVVRRRPRRAQAM